MLTRCMRNREEGLKPFHVSCGVITTDRTKQIFCRQVHIYFMIAAARQPGEKLLVKSQIQNEHSVFLGNSVVALFRALSPLFPIGWHEDESKKNSVIRVNAVTDCHLKPAFSPLVCFVVRLRANDIIPGQPFGHFGMQIASCHTWSHGAN